MCVLKTRLRRRIRKSGGLVCVRDDASCGSPIHIHDTIYGD